MRTHINYLLSVLAFSARSHVYEVKLNDVKISGGNIVATLQDCTPRMCINPCVRSIRELRDLSLFLPLQF
jgi:hypothetical protein